MLEHWPTIVSATAVGGVAILSRYVFVMKKDCNDHRSACNKTICAKINDLQNRASEAKVQAVILDKEATQTLKEINKAILEVNKSLSELKGKFDQYIMNGK